MKPQILLIDDEEDYHIIVGRILAEDYDLTMVKSFAEGAALLGMVAFDAVLLDLTLPDTPGPLQTLKQFAEYNRDMAVVVVSSHSSRDLMLLALEYGSVGYLVKNRLNPDWLKSALFSAIHLKAVQLRHRQQMDGVNRTMIDAWQSVLLIIQEMIVGLEAIQPMVKRLDHITDLISTQFGPVKTALWGEPDGEAIKRIVERMK